MDVIDLDHAEELSEEHARVCERVMRLAERLAAGGGATRAEVEEIAAAAARLRPAVRWACPGLYTPTAVSPN